MISPVNLKNHEKEDLSSDRIVKKWFQVKNKTFFYIIVKAKIGRLGKNELSLLYSIYKLQCSDW